MYEAFFGFSARPFAAAPLAKRYFPATAIELARQTLVRCIDRAEGVGLLIGPAGTGKSLLCQVLAEQFRARMQIALLSSGALCTRRALLQAILFELGLPYRGMEEGDLRLQLLDRLSPSVQAPAETISPTATAVSGAKSPAGPITVPTNLPTAGGLLLLVDEAHALPQRLLEELRLITNIVRGGQARVRLVLAGSPHLEERFASPKLNAFNQRVTARCYLESLDHQQTKEYVRAQIEQVGGQPDALFTADALEAIHSATDGIPRLINQVCDHALLLAYAGGVRQLSAPGIEEAWSDLQQLPTPRNAHQGAPARQSAGSVIEFGSLDDEETSDNLPSAVPFRALLDDRSPLSTTEQLQQITAKLAEIDDDFQPAGSIGPEVEIHLQPAPNPFTDDFDREEVVIDRYTTLEADAFANRPLVRSSESRELSALLSAAELPDAKLPLPAPVVFPRAETDAAFSENDPAGAALPLAKVDWPGGVPAAQMLPPAASLRNPSPLPPSPASNPTIALPPANPARDRRASEAEVALAKTSDFTAASLPPSQSLLIQQFASTVWPKEKQAAQVVAPNRPQIVDSPIADSIATMFQSSDSDADLIVVEETPETTLSLPKQPVAKVRRKEYRQLFSQLRHG